MTQLFQIDAAGAPTAPIPSGGAGSSLAEKFMHYLS